MSGNLALPTAGEVVPGDPVAAALKTKKLMQENLPVAPTFPEE